jgi:hypothetical protein
MPTPRQIVQELLQGNPPPRPLFLPIVFSLGARLENLPLRDFLANATKISNSLRQIRGHLRADGISCYFDPNLEAEALGATLEWEGDSVRRLNWPSAARNGGTPALRPAEVAANSARVAVAIDVIKRLNALVRDGTLLMAGVTGPFTLASKIMQRGDVDADDIPSEILEHAASVVTAISSAFGKAGANVIFVREQLMAAPPLRSMQRWDREQFENWTSLLEPTFNVIRFYQALPVLQFPTSDFVDRNRELILQQAWDCVIAVPITADDLRGFSALGLGLALPANDTPGDEELSRVISGRHPVLVTTADDVPPTTDVKRLTKVFDDVRWLPYK